MQIQVSAGSIDSQEELIAHVETEVRHTLSRFSGRITRVEVHLRDQNGEKGGRDDKLCVMEARLRGRQPVTVTHQAATWDQATGGAADKLRTFIGSVVGRLRSR